MREAEPFRVPPYAGYQELLLERITRIEGVSGVHSSFVLRQVLERTCLPVA